MSIKLSNIVKRLEEAYPPDLAEEWDRVGLIVGRPSSPIDKVLVAVDPVDTILTEAIERRAQLIVTHHPLYLRGTSFVAATDPKGSLVHRLIENGIALFNAHTNADSAAGGVADCLAQAVGLEDTRPLIPHTENTGSGRIGRLAVPMPLRDFANKVAQSLPSCPAGILVGGELDASVSTVAVSGGSGDSFLTDARRAGADVYICADLRHHPASEHLAGGRPYLICATHWASEWPWVPRCARMLQESFPKQLEVEISRICTDPWEMRISPENENR
ncbi:Nif3-like dinuclear metal center hexameric protein [Varibaculum vaginae]|uniref:Nif3-like dinuclear metal center hexameric protein n=1 Tax=Varibaculum vaginae TaxID=2364797 RepID=UPI002E0DF6CF